MNDKFYPVSLKSLLRIILNELDNAGTVFGIPEELFFVPERNARLRCTLFGHLLDNPAGVAAGPHTQLAQNIVAAWLTGARYIELKTVQDLDDLTVSKPCIDMQDEGYNCEWSQELKITESYNEYLNAWIMIHILNHKLGYGASTGTIFNMSVGYDLKGIMGEKVQWFLEKMSNCHDDLDRSIRSITDIYPRIKEINIPACISDNITLSTMHGCPANEIESIAAYLLEKKKLHTLVKLNPTLLGPERLREILNNTLSFKTSVPDIAFEHDLKFNDAVTILRSLQKTADSNSLVFGVKLTNTLESINNKSIFGDDVEMMYMSGRALHPLSANLAQRLQQEFLGRLVMSFSAGANAFNFADLIAGGFKTVTVCSDLLKPGGYSRLYQYFEEINRSMDRAGAISVEDFILKTSGITSPESAALNNLSRYAGEVLLADAYKRSYLRNPDIKTSRGLSYFDCISAPCRDTCATNQDIPDYLWYASCGQYDKAFETILRTNPFPSVTGLVCDHLCQNKCTRINYDEPLHIREVKRYVSLQDEVHIQPSGSINIKVAVIGAGPAGLTCAYYLALAGFQTEVFESGDKAGGMVRFAIPGFRLDDESIEKDIKRITDAGVKIHYSTRVNREKFESLKKEYNYIFIGAGAQLASPFTVEGAECPGVIDPLHFLFSAKQGAETGIGNNVVIIGGGNTAMDAARTAYRLTGNGGKVTVVYRRTVNEMPADQGEIMAVLNEGINVIELAAPEKVICSDGRVTALRCGKMELKGTDSSGRPTPVKIEGSSFDIPCDTVIPALGQRRDIDFATDEEIAAETLTYLTRSNNILIGGDALRGASTAITAIGDGRKAAGQIMKLEGITFELPKPTARETLSKKELIIRRSKRAFASLQDDSSTITDAAASTPDAESVAKEAERCLCCDDICNICATVCPNLANYSYETEPRTYELFKAVRKDNDEVAIEKESTLEIKQRYQILNIASFCNECGNCSTFCPTDSAPYKKKPRFFLTISAFNQAEEGYFIAKPGGTTNLIFKQKTHFTTLSLLPEGEYVYENDYVSARFTADKFLLSEVRFKTPCVKEAHFRKAVEMYILLHGANALFSADN